MDNLKTKIEIDIEGVDELVKGLKISSSELEEIKKLVKTLGFKGSEKEVEKLSAELHKAVIEIKKISGETGDMTKAFKETNTELKKGNKNLNKFGKDGKSLDLKGIFDKITSGATGSAASVLELGASFASMSEIALLAANPITALAVAVVAIGVAGANAAAQFEPLFNKISQFTGASGSDLTNYAGRIQGLANTFGASTDDIIASTNTLSKTLGITFNDALDNVTEGFINGADANGDYLEQLKEYTPILKETGIGVTELNNLIIAFNKEGVFDDKGLDAIKEGTISLRENTDAVKDALALLPQETQLKVEAFRVSEDYASALRLIAKETEKVSDQSKGVILADIFKGAGEDGEGFLKVLALSNDELSTLAENQSAFADEQSRLVEDNIRFETSMAQFGASFTEIFQDLRSYFTTFLSYLAQLGAVVGNLLTLIYKMSILEPLLEGITAAGAYLTDGLSYLNGAMEDFFAYMDSDGTLKKYEMGVKSNSAAVDEYSKKLDTLNGVQKTFEEAQKKANKELKETGTISLETQNSLDLYKTSVDKATESLNKFNNSNSEELRLFKERKAEEAQQAALKQEDITQGLSVKAYKDAIALEQVIKSQVSLEERKLALKELIELSSQQTLRAETTGEIFSGIQAKRLAAMVIDAEKSLKFEKERTVNLKKQADLARQRRLDKINALKAEEGAIDALLNEEQRTFDTAINTGNIKEAENAFEGIEDILESLDDKIGEIKESIRVAGDITSEELIKLKRLADDSKDAFDGAISQYSVLGTQYSKAVNEFISTAPNLTNRNPFFLGLQSLVDTGELSEEVYLNFIAAFGDNKGGLVSVFARLGEGVEVADDSLLSFIKSTGITGELLNRLSQDAVDGFRVLFEESKKLKDSSDAARAASDKAESDLSKTSSKRRKEAADRERELIALRTKRAELEGRLSNNAEAITKVELDRINLIRDAYQESAFTIFELLLKLERLNPDDALKNFELNRDKVLDGVAERALESIQTFNDILTSKDLGEVSFDFKADGKAFIQGLTDDIKAANPILVSQIQTVIDEYNLLIDSYAQDLERLSIETADAIANAARAVNQIALREINLDLELNNIEISNLDKALQEVIDESVAKIDYSILNTTNENEVIKQRGRDLLLLNDKEFKLRKDKLEKFYQDGIDAAEKAGEDTTLLEKEKNKELLKLQQEHAEKTEEITTKTNKGVKDNNKKLVDDAIGLVSIIGDATSQILGEVTNLLDVLGENTIEALQSQLDVINSELSETISAIDSLESDLEGKREGRREAILRGLDLEKEREAALIDEKIKAEQKLEAEEKKQAKRRKEAAIAQALINGALAITGLVSSYAPLGIAGVIPLAIQTAATIGTTALQVATISAQQFEDGGLLQGKSHAQGGIPFTINGVGGFEAEGGEAIINKRSTAMYKPLLSAINEAGGGKKFQQGAILGADFSTMNTASGSISRSDISELINKPIFVSVTDIQNTAQRQVRVTERSSI